MKLLKKLLYFYVFSNVHVAIAGFSLTRITEINYRIDNYYASVFVGLAIILSYNFIRYVEIKSDRLAWFYSWFQENLFTLKLLSGLSVLGLLYLVFNGAINFKTIIFIAPFGFMTLFYAIPLLKIGKMEVSFRNLPFIKIFSISIAWAGVTVLLPIVNAGVELEYSSYLSLITRFLFVFAITIPFDIRDVQNDNIKLKTIPQIFGLKKAKVIGVISVLILIFISYFMNKKNSIELLVVSIVIIIFLLKCTPKRNRLYTSFWVESIPILWLLLILI